MNGMMMIEISPLKDRKEFCKDIAKSVFTEWQEDFEMLTPLDTQEKLFHFYRACNDNKVPYALVAHQGTKFLGCAVMLEDDMQMKPEWSPWLTTVFVEKEFRGKGIASMLINQILSDAFHKLSIKKLYLWTFSPRFAAFYERFGFKTEEVVEKHGNHENVYVMSWQPSKEVPVAIMSMEQDSLSR